MPLWSLTKERVEKLFKQIADKEFEVDKLLKTSKEELWTVDLDAFIEEWRFQLDEEEKDRKRFGKMGRRASQKLKFGAKGPAAKKRKAIGNESDDSDFGASKAAKKTAVTKGPKPKTGGLLSHFEPLAKANQPKPKVFKTIPKAAAQAKPKEKVTDDIWMSMDGPQDLPPNKSAANAVSKDKPATALEKAETPALTAPSDDEEDDDEAIYKPVARRQRAAATKPISYGIDSDSDDNGEDLLFDVGKMVKGINSAPTDANTRLLFSNSASMSRPGSSHGLPKKSMVASTKLVDIDADDTDYSKLAPPTTKKGPAVTARITQLSDDEDDSFDAMMAAAGARGKPALPKATKPAAKASKAATAAKLSDDDEGSSFDEVMPPATNKPKPKPAPSKTTKSVAPAPKTSKSTISKPPKAPKPAANKKSAAAQAVPAPAKKLQLSPAAKAYAAKQARNQKALMEEEEEDGSDEDAVMKVANEIMDDDGDEGMAVRRPARRAAAAAGGGKKWVVESGSEEEDESDMFDDGGEGESEF